MDFWINIYFCLIVISSIFLIFAINPIESLLYLIFNFLVSALIFLRFGAEFIAILYLIIYIGAIFILFIFIIMMLNLRLIFLYLNFYNYFFISVVFVFCFFFEFCIYMYNWNISLNFFLYNFFYNQYNFFFKVFNNDNISLIGILFFNYNFLLFIFLGVILLIAMICIIILIFDLEYESINKNAISNIFFIKNECFTFMEQSVCNFNKTMIGDRFHTIPTKIMSMSIFVFFHQKSLVLAISN